MKIAAVVVTYNRIDLLKECINALEEQKVECDILIVNNNSDDGTREWIKEYMRDHKNVFCHSLKKNTGGAGGFNHGMKWAVQAGYDYVWIMDDDCIVKEDSLEKLLEADKLLGGPENYGFLSSVVLWTDGKECIMNRQKIVKSFYRHVELMKHGIVQIQQATFVSLLFPKETILKFGLPIKEYFIWGDDIEYTRRIALRGKTESYLVGQSEVVHKMKENSGSDIATDDISRLDRYRLAYRNESYTYRKQGIVGICLYLARCARGFIRILIHGNGHRLKRMCVLIKGVISGLAFCPKIERINNSN